jgi:alkanesulfonate monooxygenase SsuD/methylene tetrahydromethanopterin reductase-like flavin-dependent oxidoreductase (luciferase family)
LLLAAIGPRTLEVAGRSFDGVLLHPALTSDAVGRAREIVHRAAQGAGRDPNEIVVYSQLVVAPDLDDNETELVIGARFAAYFIPPVNSQALFRFNGWDEAPLERLRAEVQRALHANASARSPLSSRELLVNPSRTMPIEWTAAASAAGSTDYCASRMHEYLDAGADRIIIHGTTAPGIAQTIAAFVTQRAGEDFVDA